MMIKQGLTMYIIVALMVTSDAQKCVDTADVRQRGDDQLMNENLNVIVPRSNFSCNGRITGYAVSLNREVEEIEDDEIECNFPSILVWRPLNTKQTTYRIINTYMLSINDNIDREGNYYFADISFTGNNRIEIQSGDVIGYQHRSKACYSVWSNEAVDYTSYSANDIDNDTINIIDSSMTSDSDLQPLIQVDFEIQCDNLSTPANGEITSCSSGRVGVGYEEDTCSFTCNTGYELTGSDTRTCQSDGSWSGSDDVCRRATTDSKTDMDFTSDNSMFVTTTIMPATGITASGAGSSASVDSMVSTGATVTLSSSSSVVLVTTPPINARQEQNDDGGSDVGGIVAGCVVAFIVFVAIVVCLIIFLMWYRAKKKRGDITRSGLEEQNGKSALSKHLVELKEGSLKNTEYDSCNYYSSADQLVDANGLTIEPTPYLEPVKTVGIFPNANNDYEVLPKLDNYEQPHTSGLFYNAEYEAADYSLPTIVGSDTMQNSTSPVGQVLSKDEQIYEDPGHITEEIYKWFKQRNICKLDKNIISVSDFIGSGEFGTVHLGLWSNGSTDPVQVAVKTLNSRCSESDRVKFLREAAIMGQFVHNNVVELHGVVTEEENMMIVLEYMSKGDLQNNLLKARTHMQTIKAQEEWSELKNSLLSYCRQIAAGMNYLANKQFVHRDLAARNILLSNNDACKIADFGMARDVADDNYYITTGGKIPLRWTSLEAIYYKKYSAQSDVWSFGCVMYEIWSLGHKPFEGYKGKEYVDKITTGYRLPPPPGCPRAMYELMIQCWHPEARNRPHPGLVLRTLQKSDRNLLQWSMLDDDKSDGQVAMLGAPLSTSEHLYPDLQSLYMKTD